MQSNRGALKKLLPLGWSQITKEKPSMSALCKVSLFCHSRSNFHEMEEKVSRIWAGTEKAPLSQA